ncbi:DEAD-box RNA helicase [Plasmodium falciparum RAJ116]|uniref:ATP-dependent RNA helicase n=1 Tax=Plasmodium falciparum RAJ116 TaxID=580058 RepID=A0A0L0CYY6_PLAFA|nr:DEAD-box RNA helicase [Plasmodium falciparum RAJ116]
METQEAPNIETKDEKQNGDADIIVTNKDEQSSKKKEENKPADDNKPSDKKQPDDDNKYSDKKQPDDDNKSSDKKQPADDNKDNAGSDNVMNMFLNYLQKNKDDPAILQTMMSMMSGQNKNNLSASDLLSFTNSLNKKGEEKGEKNKEEEKKENEMPSEDLKNPSELITKEEKNEDNISTSDTQNVSNNIITKSESDTKQNNDSSSNNNNNNNYSVSEKVSGEENTNNNNNEEVVKKKHSVLVEDNDDYEIEETVEPKEPVEEEAISIIENININNKEKEKKGNDLFSPTSSSIENNNNDNNKESSDFKLYHSKNTWEELKIDNELIQILTYLKFLGPSKIQAYALPIILSSNKNLIAQSQNGSGKTLTFVIAMLCKINRTLSSLQAVCICPTRELSQQNYDVVCNFTKYLNVKVFLAVPLCERYNKSGGYQIYVGTPGKNVRFF